MKSKFVAECLVFHNQICSIQKGEQQWPHSLCNFIFMAYNSIQPAHGGLAGSYLNQDSNPSVVGLVD